MGLADETISDTTDTTDDTTNEAALQEPKDTDTQTRDSSKTKRKEGSNAMAAGIDVTGAWSLDLQGKTSRHLGLDLIQNKEAIMGSVTVESNDGIQKVTASGSLDGKRLGLALMPVGSLDLYKLDLSLDPETTGSYTSYSSTEASWSGDASGTAPKGISSSTADNSEDSQESYDAASDSDTSRKDANEDAAVGSDSTRSTDSDAYKPST